LWLNQADNCLPTAVAWCWKLIVVSLPEGASKMQATAHNPLILSGHRSFLFKTASGGVAKAQTTTQNRLIFEQKL